MALPHRNTRIFKFTFIITATTTTTSSSSSLTRICDAKTNKRTERKDDDGRRNDRHFAKVSHFKKASFAFVFWNNIKRGRLDVGECVQRSLSSSISAAGKKETARRRQTLVCAALSLAPRWAVKMPSTGFYCTDSRYFDRTGQSESLLNSTRPCLITRASERAHFEQTSDSSLTAALI